MNGCATVVYAQLGATRHKSSKSNILNYIYLNETQTTLCCKTMAEI